MSRYFKIISYFFINNLIRELEFRTNFIIRIVLQLLFVFLSLVTIEVFYRFTNTINGWSKADILVITAIFRLVEGIFHVFVHSNLLYLPEIISRGDLDQYLTKPIDSQFMISFRYQQIYEVSTFVSGGLLLWYANFLGNKLHIFDLLVTMPILVICGFVSLYSIILLFSTLSLFTTKLTALSSFWDIVSKTSRFPVDILDGNSKIGLWFIAPLFLVATLPAQLILGKVGFFGLIVEVLATISIFIISRIFWKFSLKHYSSASS